MQPGFLEEAPPELGPGETRLRHTEKRAEGHGVGGEEQVYLRDGRILLHNSWLLGAGAELWQNGQGVSIITQPWGQGATYLII